MQEVSSCYGEWPKKSKLEMEEEARQLVRQQKTSLAKLVAAAVMPSMMVLASLAPIVMATKNKTRSKDFQP